MWKVKYDWWETMRKRPSNVFSELYFDKYELCVDEKNIKYFEEKQHAFSKVTDFQKLSTIDICLQQQTVRELRDFLHNNQIQDVNISFKNDIKNDQLQVIFRFRWKKKD